MRKLCCNKPLILGLVTTFLFLQWSAAHFHLASEHKHNGSQHQHTATAHQHQSTSHHTDVIDVTTSSFSHADSSKIVELEQSYTQTHGKPGKIFAIIPSLMWNNFNNLNDANHSPIPFQKNNYQSCHQYTSIRLRAPPVAS